MITGQTKLYGVIGDPVSHSISPQIQNAAFELTNTNAAYLAFQANEQTLPEVVRGLTALGAGGWNVTMPCKTAMAAMCQTLSPAAELTGSVNTVVNQDGHLYGHTTDGAGFLSNLTAHRTNWQHKKITILGAGGAARAIAAQAVLMGCPAIAIYNRNVDKAVRLAEVLRRPGCELIAGALDNHEGLIKDIRESAVLVNATSLGMEPNIGVSPIEDPGVLNPATTVADIVYHPVRTKLMMQAERMGCPTVSGLGMLLRQGAESFKLWTGKEMPVEAVARRVFGSER